MVQAIYLISVAIFFTSTLKSKASLDLKVLLNNYFVHLHIIINFLVAGDLQRTSHNQVTIATGVQFCHYTVICFYLLYPW